MTTTIPTPLFTHRIADDAVLVPRTAAISDAYHELVTSNQERLARWERWALEPLTPDGTRNHLVAAGQGWLEGSELPVAIAVLVADEWRLAGSVGLKIDRSRRTGDLGYWVDGAFEGRGLVTMAASAILDQAFGPLALDKVTLHTEVANDRSRTLARRLGFTEEGELREAIPFPDRRRNVVVYGLLAPEWRRRTAHPTR
ncbi:MAG: GNAT family N-acetyltransferase [Acidimicrobiales bacterium]